MQCPELTELPFATFPDSSHKPSQWGNQQGKVAGHPGKSTQPSMLKPCSAVHPPGLPALARYCSIHPSFSALTLQHSSHARQHCPCLGHMWPTRCLPSSPTSNSPAARIALPGLLPPSCSTSTFLTWDPTSSHLTACVSLVYDKNQDSRDCHH